jgi:uncharacterized protein (DUF169 family)
MYDFEKPRGLPRNVERAVKIDKHLRIPTLPVGLKFFKKDETVPNGLGKESDWVGTFCQFLSQARFDRCSIRKNYIVRRKDIVCPYAPGVVGFEEWSTDVSTGEHMGGVHFENAEAARRAQTAVPKIEPFSISALLVGPLMDLAIDPDVIAIAFQPGMSNKILDGAMWNSGEPYTIKYYNMCGTCSAVAQAYNEKKLIMGLPDHGTRRMALFGDTELFAALHLSFFDEWILGMEKSFVTGHSFPVGYMLQKPPACVPHFKIVEWPDKVVPFGELEE